MWPFHPHPLPDNDPGRDDPVQAWTGWPSRSEESSWHWLEDVDGLRPLLWRGGDWPDAVDRHSWQDGYAVLAPSDLHGARYWGPAHLPPGAAARLRRTLRLDAA